MSNPTQWAVRVRNIASLSVATALLNSLLNAAVVLGVIALGRAEEVGSYTAGSVAASFAAVFLSAGTTIQYVAADERQRSCIRAWRVNYAFPLLLLAGGVIGWIYARLGYNLMEVTFAAWAIALNSLSELHYSAYQRELRYGTASTATLTSKLLVLLLALAVAVPLPMAFLLAAAYQLGFLEVRAGESRLRGQFAPIKRATLSDSLDAVRFGRPLAVYSFSEYASNRFDSLVVSLFATPTTTGLYGATYTIFGSLVTGAYAILQTTLPLRRRALDTGAAELMLDVERVRRWAIGAAAVAAVCLAVFAKPLTGLLIRSADPRPVWWLMILAPALPLLIVARSEALASIAARKYDIAARIALYPTILGAASAIVLVAWIGATGGAISTTIQELVAAVLAITVFRASQGVDARDGKLARGIP